MNQSIFSFYSKEVKSGIAVVLLLSALVLFIRFRHVLIEKLFSQTGLTVLLALAVAGVLSLVIKIYYQVMIFRYYRK